MVRTNEGLTKTYNGFHDPQERSPDLQTLRDLHARMDAAVLDTHGWTDLPTGCEFILDCAEEKGKDLGTLRPGDLPRVPSSPRLPVAKSQSRRRKPWRCRWPDEIRDEALARLLKLNAKRAREEKLAGLAAAVAPAKAKRRKGEAGKRRGGAAPAPGDLLPPSQEDLFV